MSNLKNRTIFITGATRGIGREIALRVARDGANIVVTGKTAQPNPKVAGTIHSTAYEIEEAGGQALSVQLDVRDENAVVAAVKTAAEKCDGIDALVNNASAISIIGTMATPVKRYDVMNQINARATFICSQACIPHRSKSDIANILTLSPLLNMNQKWVQGACRLYDGHVRNEHVHARNVR